MERRSSSYNSNIDDAEAPVTSSIVNTRREETADLGNKGKNRDGSVPTSNERSDSEIVTMKLRNGCSRLGTWNVRILQQAGKLDNCTQEMTSHKMDILGLAEVRWTESGHVCKGVHTMYFSGGDQHKHGVAVATAEAEDKQNQFKDTGQCQIE